MSALDPQAKTDLTAAVSRWRDTGLDDFIHLERGRSGTLELFLEPADERELARLIRALRSHAIPTTTIAGRTGLVEAQRPHGVAIGMGRFQELGEVALADGTTVAPRDLASLANREPADLRGATARVGAGLSIDAVNEALAPARLKLPIGMGSTATATAGACAANGSAGANAVRYGTAAHLALRVRGVLGTGEIVEQEIPAASLEKSPGRCRIRSDRFSLGDSLVGSQGALGLITEVVYEVVPVPRDRAALLLPVPDAADALHIFEQFEARFHDDDSGVELFEILRRHTLQRGLAHAELSLRDGVGEAPYYALILLTSESTTQPAAVGSALLERALAYAMTEARDRAGGLPFAAGNVDFDHRPERLLAIREACSEMSRELPKQSYDVVVPVERLDALVQGLESLVAEEHPRFQLSIFGHGGVGALHVHVIAEDPARLAAAQPGLDTAVFDLVQGLGGSPWAEHGVGSKWAAEWRRRTPVAVQQEMLEIKRRCDPDNVLGSRLFGFDVLLRG